MKQYIFCSFACVYRCWDALELNKKLITEEQKDYQKELSAKFKLFCDKLEPMVSTKKKHKRSRWELQYITSPCYQAASNIEWLLQGQGTD